MLQVMNMVIVQTVRVIHDDDDDDDVDVDVFWMVSIEQGIEHNCEADGKTLFIGIALTKLAKVQMSLKIPGSQRAAVRLNVVRRSAKRFVF